MNLLSSSTINFSADFYRKVLEKIFIDIVELNTINRKLLEKFLILKVQQISDENSIFLRGKAIIDIMISTKNMNEEINQHNYLSRCTYISKHIYRYCTSVVL